MTKKDIVFLADLVIDVTVMAEELQIYEYIPLMEAVKGILAERLKRNYPMFDEEKWYKYIDEALSND